MRAIMVAVNYSDLLAITLPYNLHHFEEVWIVTDPANEASVATILGRHADSDTCLNWLTTDLFYANGATFNKWAALEWGLDQMGRHGWICLMDADVLWPKVIAQCCPPSGGTLFLNGLAVNIGQLCSPLRRMWNEWPNWPMEATETWAGDPVTGLLLESQWSRFPIHRNVNEWAGYSQIFHASDPALGPPPWHEVDWRHAGSADSFFQRRWPAERKVRPPFEVLHLGTAGQNWFGRSTPLADGSLLPGSEERRELSGRKIWEARRANRASGRDQFDGERIDQRQ